MQKQHFLIIGQGIAGTWLSHELLQRGQSVQVVDAGLEKAASWIAPGTFNPINLSRYSKNWRMEEALPVLRERMQTMEKELDREFFYERPLLRPFQNPEEVSMWKEKARGLAFATYLRTCTPGPTSREGIDFPYGYGEVEGAGFADLPVFLKAYRSWLSNENMLIETAFRPEVVSLHPSHVEWHGFKADRLILCTGIRASQSPWFREVPFSPVKGEALTVEIPGLECTSLIKGKVFLVPLGENRYRVGSNYDRGFTDDMPTAEGKTRLLGGLEEMIGDRREVRVLAHHAGIRPTVKRHRPVLGLHPENDRIGIFNGLASKGVSLAPYLAMNLADHLVEGTPLDQEADVMRFFSGPSGN